MQDDDFEDDFQENLKEQVKDIAAPLIAANDNDRASAIARAVQYLQYQIEAANDPTRTVETLDEAQFPEPSSKASDAQINAIKREIDDDAQNAVDQNF